LHDRLAAISPGALEESLELLVEGRAPREVQNESEATYAAKLGREHGEIRWAEPATVIDRKIRAMNPWPSAHTWLRSPEGPKKLKVFSCIQYRRQTGPAGTVLRSDRNGILVGAGEGSILLREVQMEGKRRMDARDFLLGNPVPPGTILGAAA
jgi:methionyl-tRNA formyltransferase